MRNEELGITENNLYTLIPLVVFKALLGIDDRKDKITRFCGLYPIRICKRHCSRFLNRRS